MIYDDVLREDNALFQRGFMENFKARKVFRIFQFRSVSLVINIILDCRKI